MSLKTMHAVFVLLSCTFAVFFALWSWREWSGGGSAVWAAVSVSSGASALALVVYGVGFIRKTRGLA